MSENEVLEIFQELENNSEEDLNIVIKKMIELVR